MLLDIRTYRCRPGTINAHLALYQEFGKEPQFRCLGEPLAYVKGETPNPNEYVHIWVYKDAADRAAKRAAMAADPEWQTFLKKSAEAGNLVSQVNTILTPASFFEPPTRPE